MKRKMKFFGIGLIAVFAAMGLYLWGQYTAQTGKSIEIVKEAEAAGGAKYSSNVKNPTGTMSPRDMYFPGTEELGPDEMRVVACGTGMPASRRGQAATCWLLELGNGDTFFFDLGPGSVKNAIALQKPPQQINDIFITHLHVDHYHDLSYLPPFRAWSGHAAGDYGRQFCWSFSWHPF